MADLERTPNITALKLLLLLGQKYWLCSYHREFLRRVLKRLTKIVGIAEFNIQKTKRNFMKRVSITNYNLLKETSHHYRRKSIFSSHVPDFEHQYNL